MINNNDRVVDIIEDRIAMENLLLEINDNLRNGAPMPTFIPPFNDGVMQDIMSSICSQINKLRIQCGII